MFGKRRIVACDGRCEKAWGINSRPRVRFDDADDYAFLSDGELGEAPCDPLTYEGGHAKPQITHDQLNKWCVRECERSRLFEIGETVYAEDFSRRVYNQPSNHSGI